MILTKINARNFSNRHMLQSTMVWNKGEGGREKIWTRRDVEPVKTRMKLTRPLYRNVYIALCDLTSVYMTPNTHGWTMWRQNQRLKCRLAQTEKKQRECHAAINHFWSSPKMCKFPLWFSAECTWVTKKEENTRGNLKRGGRKTQHPLFGN